MIGLLCSAVVEELQAAFDPQFQSQYPLLPDMISVMPDERPPPHCGSLFLSVYGSDFSPSIPDANVSLDADLSLELCLTMRSTSFSTASFGREGYTAAYRGMSSIAWKIMTTLDKKPSVVSRVYAYPEYLVLRESYAQMYEFLRWRGTSARPEPVYEDHFRAKNEHLDEEGGEAIMGYKMTLTFGGVKAGNLQV